MGEHSDLNLTNLLGNDALTMSSAFADFHGGIDEGLPMPDPTRAINLDPSTEVHELQSRRDAEGDLSGIRQTRSRRTLQPIKSPWVSRPVMLFGMDTYTVLSFQPHVYRPRSPDAQLHLPPISSGPLHTLYNRETFQVYESDRAAMAALVTLPNRSPWADIVEGAFPSTQTLTTCVEQYFQHFHDSFPVLCRSNFHNKSERMPILLLAIAAIGATYSRDGLERLAIPMNELVRRALLFMVGMEVVPFISLSRLLTEKSRLSESMMSDHFSTFILFKPGYCRPCWDFSAARASCIKMPKLADAVW